MPDSRQAIVHVMKRLVLPLALLFSIVNVTAAEPDIPALELAAWNGVSGARGQLEKLAETGNLPAAEAMVQTVLVTMHRRRRARSS
jgi:hypothetical protein